MNYKMFCGDFYKEAKKSSDVLKRCEAVTCTAIEQDILFATIIIIVSLKSSSSCPTPSLTTMSSALLQFFCVACG